MTMPTLQFEAVKLEMKQNKSGIILTLNIHPDDLPPDLMRDFVGARYQVVMVRLNGEDRPMNRDTEYQRDAVRFAGILCRDKAFAKYLMETGQIFEETESNVVDWLKSDLEISSRAELRENIKAAKRLWTINEEFQLWKRSA
jgi:hypothetical protein